MGVDAIVHVKEEKEENEAVGVENVDVRITDQVTTRRRDMCREETKIRSIS